MPSDKEYLSEAYSGYGQELEIGPLKTTEAPDNYQTLVSNKNHRLNWFVEDTTAEATQTAEKDADPLKTTEVPENYQWPVSNRSRDFWNWVNGATTTKLTRPPEKDFFLSSEDENYTIEDFSIPKSVMTSYPPTLSTSSLKTSLVTVELITNYSDESKSMKPFRPIQASLTEPRTAVTVTTPPSTVPSQLTSSERLTSTTKTIAKSLQGRKERTSLDSMDGIQISTQTFVTVNQMSPKEGSTKTPLENNDALLMLFENLMKYDLAKAAIDLGAGTLSTDSAVYIIEMTLHILYGYDSVSPDYIFQDYMSRVKEAKDHNDDM